MSKKLRVGIVGAGRIFDLHALGYLGNDDTEIVSICDLDESWLAKRKALFPEARFTTSFQELLGQDLDLVEILTPHPLHEDMTVAALEAGSHVSVQKPMALTTGSCDEMIAASERTGRNLKVFENFVFYPPLVKAKELLNSGAIGAPLQIRLKVVVGDRSGAWHVPVQSNAWRFELGRQGQGGPLVFDHGHHLLAVALWLFGDVRDCFAFMENTKIETGEVKYELDAPTTLVWRHKNPPVHATCDYSLALNMELRTDYYAVDERFEIQGEEGIIQVNRCSGRMLDEPALTVYSKGKTEGYHTIASDWSEGFRRSTLHYIDVLKDRKKDIVLTGSEGRRVVELYHSLARSAEDRRAIEPGQ